MNTERCIHSGVAINITVLNRIQSFLTLTKRERRRHKIKRDNYSIIYFARGRRGEGAAACVYSVGLQRARASMESFAVWSRRGLQLPQSKVDRATGFGLEKVPVASENARPPRHRRDQITITGALRPCSAEANKGSNDAHDRDAARLSAEEKLSDVARRPRTSSPVRRL